MSSSEIKKINTKIVGFLLTALAVVVVGFSFAFFSVSAQNLPAECNDPSGPEEEAFCKELKQLEEEMAQWRQILNTTRGQSASIERDIRILEARIEEARLSIRAKNLTIEELRGDISERTETLEELQERIERSRESLAELIRKKNQLDLFSMLEVVLSNENLSEFFEDLNSIDAVKESLQVSLEQIREIQNLTNEEREALTVQVAQETDAKAVIEAERQAVQRNEEEKQYLLEINRTQEKTYEQVLREREQRAAQIRSALFALRDATDIPFGEALEYARQVQQVTGVRPAFLLAVITQESNLGANVGTCNRPGDSRTWRDIMPGPNDNSWRDDQTIFQQLMSELGRSPEGTPLSCPWQGGWGGAMGPAQFIPATWQSFQSRIASAVGVSTPDPWNPHHAFTASGLYLADLGAAGGGFTAERTAALKYYAGGNWNNPSNAFYGNQVMDHANRIQNNINVLEGI